MKPLLLSIICLAITVTAHAAQRVPPEIAKECAERWKTDYPMQLFCREKQMKALEELREQDVLSAPEVHDDAVKTGLDYAQSLFKKGGIDALNAFVDECSKKITVRTFWQAQHCMTVDVYAMLIPGTDGRNSPDATRERDLLTLVRQYGVEAGRLYFAAWAKPITQRVNLEASY